MAAKKPTMVNCPHCKGTGRVVKAKKVPWKCPACQAPAGSHGTGECVGGQGAYCDGLICECEDDGTEGHGEVETDPCRSANCQHCGWGGEMPKDAYKKQKRPNL